MANGFFKFFFQPISLMPEMPREFQRLPAQELRVKEVNASVKRAALLGRISSWNEEDLQAVFSDGSGQAVLEFDGEQKMLGLKENVLVRVIGRPFYKNDALLINVETVHEMPDADQALFEKIRGLEKKFLG